MATPKDNRWCLICRPKNRTLYWHKNAETNDIWCYCNKCDRAYSLHDYCYKAGIELADFLKGDFQIEEARPNEVQAMAWPASFIPLSDPRAQPAVDYLKNVRKMSLEGDMYYDMDRNGIVFPYYFGNHFVGAQIRLIVPKDLGDGEFQKMDTIPGTRLGLLFYGWNQSRFVGNVKGVIITEGAINALSLQQALNLRYGGIARNPWRAIACSGAGATDHQKDAIKELRDEGVKTIVAPDTDEAGVKMFQKFNDHKSVSHVAFTEDTEKDWNDMLKDLGHKDLADFFLGKVKPT